MRRNRRKNWFIRRIAVGFAIAAFVAPVAQAKVDEGIQGQLNTVSENVKPIPYRWPSSADEVVLNANHDQIVQAHTYQPAQTQVGTYGMPHALPHDPAMGAPSPHDPALFVRTQPRSIGEPQVVAAGFDWKDAGIGAGLALALVLLAGGAALASRHVGRAQTA